MALKLLSLPYLTCIWTNYAMIRAVCSLWGTHRTAETEIRISFTSKQLTFYKHL